MTSAGPPCRRSLTLACTAPIRKLDPQALAPSRHNTHNAQSTYKSTTMASLVQGGIYRVRYGTKTSSSTQRIARHAPREDWDNPMTAGALSRWVLWNKETLHDSIVDYIHRFDMALV